MLAAEDEDFEIRLRRSDGYFISKKKALILAIVVVVVIILVGVLAGVLPRVVGYPNGNNLTTMAPTNGMTAMPTSAKPVSPYAAVNNIRLPKNVIPVHYWFELEIDMNLLAFNGTNIAELNITSQTNIIIFHIKDLQITASPRVATDRAFTNLLAIKEHASFKPNEYYYIVLQNPANVGTYYVNFEFKAPLSTVLNGLYKSSYTKPDGSKK